jgi:TonB-dependent receptor
MQSARVRFLSLLFMFGLLATNLSLGQNSKATLAGSVKDESGAVLQGARITLEPAAQPAASNGQGAFFFNSLAPGNYKVTVSFVGFEPYTKEITLTAGQTTQIDAVLKVASASDEVIVTAERPHGDAEAINRTLAAENILQVLPADVITSLPNANIADALGRMPSVSIERDEGEGKYVQIRGTEPRLSNTMVDGVSIPSPESGVRQIKLDTIASDLVDSVEINKTLQANIDGDGIGGSVNLVTKTASDTPTIALYGVGGYTPIIGGREVNQMGGTIGKRFLADKKLGVLVGGTYDYNGRGINDIEPVATAGSVTPHYDAMDFRDYVYNRTRWGATGSLDYKFNEGSDIALRTLFSTFRNWGNKWAFSMNDGSTPQYSQDWRRPNLAIGSMSLQGHHVFNASTILWSASVSRSRSLGGSGGASFEWRGDPNAQCTNVPGISVYRPGWAGCVGSGIAAAANGFDVNNYAFTEFDYPTFGQSVQLNLQASGSYARVYHVGTHYGTFEFGAKIRNAHKFDDTYDLAILAQDAAGNDTSEPISKHPEWRGGFSDPNYYDNTYKSLGAYPTITDWGKLKTWVEANKGSSGLTASGGPGINSNNFDLIERIPAGYVMNTIEIASRVRLLAGVRFEATHVDTLSFDGSLPTPPTSLTFKAGGDYLDVLPSASLRFAVDKDSDLRLAYGRGLARPDPQDLSAAVGQPDKTQNPPTISIGNPNLKAERANNYDVLYERSLSHTGLLQAGYFYKDLTQPITSVVTNPTTGPFAGYRVTQPGNAGSAYVQGIEIGIQQRLSYLPSVLGGAGISANYSRTSSTARDLPGRSDQPALLRDAPNTWNISPTYDTKKFSMRVGMTYDDAMVYQYQWQDGADSIGPKGPVGDIYLYSHVQFDTQASYQLPWGFQVYGYGLNMNNEVFGFFNGSPQYVLQREYYHPTYAGGVRWNLTRER